MGNYLSSAPTSGDETWRTCVPRHLIPDNVLSQPTWTDAVIVVDMDDHVWSLWGVAHTAEGLDAILSTPPPRNASSYSSYIVPRAEIDKMVYERG